MVIPSMPNAEALTISVGITDVIAMPRAVCLHSGLTQHQARGADARERGMLLRFSNRERIIALAIAGAFNIAMVMMASAAFHAGSPEVAEIGTACHTLTLVLGGAAAGVFLVSPMASRVVCVSV